MRSFYKRFVRDYLRYRDDIQCLGHQLVAAVREDARTNGNPSGEYYALHIRRGDFEFKVRETVFLAAHLHASDVHVSHLL